MTGEKYTPQQVWGEYSKGVSYNTQLNLYEQVKKNENFYIGKQWEGLNAPDLNKPVINVLKRVVSYFISMIVSDDVGASFTPFVETQEEERNSKILSESVDEVIETANIKALSREIIRDAAVDGDGFLYMYFDPDAETGQSAKGRICAEILQNVNVMYGNPYSDELQTQPYIILSMRKYVDAVKAEAQENGQDTENIRSDADSNQYDVANTAQDNLATVLIRMWKQGGRVYAVKTTADAVIKPAWDTGCSLYPLACMRWERVKNSYHGQAAVTAMIPNQISINQLFAMAIHSVQSTAFPKVIFDRTKLSGWSNKIGQAIGVVGNPNDAIATGYRAPDMSGQVMDLIDRLIQKTSEFMGASDAALGNIKPDNTSAIIATQKASAMPLELQRLEFYRFTEEYIRVILDMISANYGVREITYEEDGNKVVGAFDFSLTGQAGYKLKVDVGSAAYWSEVMQIQTLDNMFRNNIIPDAITYVENIPDQYIKGKNKIIEKLKEQQLQMQQMQAMPQGAVPPQDSGMPAEQLQAAIAQGMA